MIRLSRSSEYAIRAVVQLASAPPGTRRSCPELARKGKLPERYLLHILRRLVDCGILYSTRGTTGGYQLARAPRQITLLNLVEAVENTFSQKPTIARGLGPIARARLAKMLQSASRAANAELQKVTLADLVPHKRRRR